MRYLLLILLAVATLFPSTARAYDVLVLMSRRVPVLEEVLKGFQGDRRFSSRVVVLSDYTQVDVPRIVREESPRLILTVGDGALAAARAVRSTPVLSVMALTLEITGVRQPNLTGISMFVPPKQFIPLFKEMKAHRVGVVHDPTKCGRYLQQASQEARRAGIELVVRDVASSQETQAQLASLKGKVDALWMWPDTTAVTRNTVDAYANFSLEEQVPLVSFSGEYLKFGAAAAQVIDYPELGRQANELARKILNGAVTDEQSVVPPHHVTLKTNSTVIKRFGFSEGRLSQSGTE